MKEIGANWSNGDTYLNETVTLKRFAGRFSGMVIPNTSCRLRHANNFNRSQFEVSDANDNPVLNNGNAIFGD